MYSQSNPTQTFSSARKTDTALAVTVEDALSTYECSGRHKITARVLDGVVTLQGTVCSDELRKTIANVVRNLPGVEGFRNYISICPAEHSIRAHDAKPSPPAI